MIHYVLLSVIMAINYPDGQQSILQSYHKFTGPTAIEYCQNAIGRFNATNSFGLMKIKATCTDF